MKKFMNYFLSLFAFASILFLASCGDDGEIPIPGDSSITLSTADNRIENDTLKVFPGDTVAITASLGIGSSGDITVLSDDAGVVVVPTPNTIASGDAITVTVPTDAQADALATLTFSSGNANKQLIVMVEAPIVDVTAYEAFLLYAPTADATSQTFFSTSTGETYSYNDVVNTSDPVSELIDFGYFYGATAGASLQSADDYTTSSTYDLTQWTTRNTTMFRTTDLTVDDFDAITESQGNDVEAFYETGSELDNPKRISGLVAGDVVAFTTSDSRFGLVQVVEIVDGNADGSFDGIEDGIRIAVKVTNAVE